MNPLIRPWRQLFNFTGRATRTEYGLFHLSFIGLWIAVEVLMIGILSVAGVGPGSPPPAQNAAPNIVVMVIAGLFSILWLVSLLAFFIGHISVSVRRLHDHGDSGFKYLLTFIPLAGIVFWAIMVFTPGNDWENEYGPDPRHPTLSDGELGGVFS